MKSGKSKDANVKKPPKPLTTGEQQQAASGTGQQYGEGSYSGTKQYNEGVKDHMQHHDVEREARNAAPRNRAEEKDMEDAEREGRSRAKDDDENDVLKKGE